MTQTSAVITGQQRQSTVKRTIAQTHCSIITPALFHSQNTIPGGRSTLAFLCLLSASSWQTEETQVIYLFRHRIQTKLRLIGVTASCIWPNGCLELSSSWNLVHPCIVISVAQPLYGPAESMNLHDLQVCKCTLLRAGQFCYCPFSTAKNITWIIWLSFICSSFDTPTSLFSGYFRIFRIAFYFNLLYVWQNTGTTTAQRILSFVFTQTSFPHFLQLTASVCMCISWCWSLFFFSGTQPTDNFIVGLSNVSPVSSAPILWNYDVCAQYEGPVIPGTTVFQPCTSEMPPRRYIIVQIERTAGVLNFCEVQVYVHCK